MLQYNQPEERLLLLNFLRRSNIMINLFLWAVIGGLAGLFGGPFIIGGKDSEMNKMNIIIGLAGRNINRQFGSCYRRWSSGYI